VSPLPSQRARVDAPTAPSSAPVLSLRQHRSFQTYWLGEATALAGSSVSAVALPVITAMELDATPGQVSTLACAMMAPAFLPSAAGAGRAEAARSLYPQALEQYSGLSAVDAERVRRRLEAAW
jgi:hypothetical protein